MANAEELKLELLAEEKYHEERIGHVERNFAAISVSMSGIARKTALMRDKGDKLTQTLKTMAVGETGQLKASLENVSECVGALEDYRQTELDRLEAKVVKPFLEYDNVCRKAKEELKACNADREKVINQQRMLDRTRIREPTNTRKLTQLETNLQKAKFKRNQSTKTLEEHMSGFEKRRVRDLKDILQEYIHTEMLFHAKALELLTLSYQHIDHINEDEALEAYLNNLQVRRRRGLLEEPYPTSETPTHGTPPLHRHTPPHHQRTTSEPSLSTKS